MMTNDPTLQGFFELIEWAFDVALPIEGRQAIANELAAGWNDEDQSEQMLVSEILQGRAILLSLPDQEREARRPYTREVLKTAMAQQRPDDCGRVLFRLKDVLEFVRPGVTAQSSLSTGSFGASTTQPYGGNPSSLGSRGGMSANSPGSAYEASMAMFDRKAQEARELAATDPVQAAQMEQFNYQERLNMMQANQQMAHRNLMTIIQNIR
jgi:hypothetical protein